MATGCSGQGNRWIPPNLRFFLVTVSRISPPDRTVAISVLFVFFQKYDIKNLPTAAMKGRPSDVFSRPRTE
jgi:hypothetical protein